MGAPAMITAPAPVEPLRLLPVTACPACGSPERKELFTAPDRLHGTPGEFRYQRCLGCASVYQDPRVADEDLARCYPETYYTHEDHEEAPWLERPPADAGLRGLRDRLRAATRHAVRGGSDRGWIGLAGRLAARSKNLRARAFYHRLEDVLLPWLPPPARALDVGCGAGQILRELRRAGWDAEGVEWDPGAARVAERSTGCRVWVGDFAELPLPESCYDLVLLSHVFEHLPEPGRALRSLTRLLRPGGRLVLTFPNGASLGSRTYRDCWFAWDPPRHLVIPSARALRRLARDAGLRVRRLTSMARTAAFTSAASRVYQAGAGAGDPERPGIDDRDRRFGRREALLVRLGVLAGEELLAVLEKP